jgi:hypothetical protein
VVEQLVQRRRQGEAVGDGGRAAVAVPMHMRGFESEQRAAGQGLEAG